MINTSEGKGKSAPKSTKAVGYGPSSVSDTLKSGTKGSPSQGKSKRLPQIVVPKRKARFMAK